MTPHLRLDIVYESVGGSMFQDAVDNLAVKGRVILIGFISGAANTLPKQNTCAHATPPLTARAHCIRLQGSVWVGRLNRRHPKQRCLDATAALHVGQRAGLLFESLRQVVGSTHDAARWHGSGRKTEPWRRHVQSGTVRDCGQ